MFVKTKALPVLLLASMLAVLAGYGFNYPSAFWDVMLQRAPLLVPPKPIELATAEIGQVAVQPVHIENRGNKPQIIDHIRISCLCAGLEMENEGVYQARFTIKGHQPFTLLLDQNRLPDGLTIQWETSAAPSVVHRGVVTWQGSEPSSTPASWRIPLTGRMESEIHDASFEVVLHPRGGP